MMGNKNARNRLIRSFLIIFLLAALFIGVSAYFIVKARSCATAIDDRLVKLTQALTLAGVFFLILDFVFILPKFFIKDRFANENVMRQAFEKYLKSGETIEAGIYTTVTESYVNATYKKCRYEHRRLIRDENATDVFSLGKQKYCEYKVFLGISQENLFVVECEENKHYYETPARITVPFEIPDLPEDISDREVGVKYGLSEIKEVKTEPVRFNAVLCTVTMINGSYFKIRMDDNAGPISDMPHHLEYRDRILSMLKECGARE